MKKKIFFIMSTDDYSGAEEINFKIIETLKNTYDFFWVSKKGRINEFLSEKKIHWIEIKKLSIKEIKRVVKKYNPDILHATDYTASCICSLSNPKIPIIAHLHHNNPWIKKINPYSILFLICSRKMEKILTVSPAIEKEYIFSKKIRKKILCINNPVSTEEIIKKVNKKDFQKKYDICCTARVSDVKQPFLFIDIIRELKNKKQDIKAIWIGNGELIDSCKSYIIEHGLENNIEFVGFKSNPFKLMASSKIFLLTSAWEGYGLVAFEALTLGLPCLVSNVGGLPYIVNDSCGKLCNNINEFVNEAKTLLENKEYCNRKSESAIMRAKDIDNFTEYMETINNIYINL